MGEKMIIYDLIHTTPDKALSEMLNPIFLILSSKITWDYYN